MMSSIRLPSLADTTPRRLPIILANIGISVVEIVEAHLFCVTSGDRGRDRRIVGATEREAMLLTVTTDVWPVATGLYALPPLVSM